MAVQVAGPQKRCHGRRSNHTAAAAPSRPPTFSTCSAKGQARQAPRRPAAKWPAAAPNARPSTGRSGRYSAGRAAGLPGGARGGPPCQRRRGRGLAVQLHHPGAQEGAQALQLRPAQAVAESDGGPVGPRHQHAREHLGLQAAQPALLGLQQRQLLQFRQREDRHSGAGPARRCGFPGRPPTAASSDRKPNAILTATRSITTSGASPIGSASLDQLGRVQTRKIMPQTAK